MENTAKPKFMTYFLGLLISPSRAWLMTCYVRPFKRNQLVPLKLNLNILSNILSSNVLVEKNKGG